MATNIVINQSCCAQDTVQPKRKSRRNECDSCHHSDTTKYRPLWEEMGTSSANDLYKFMAWQALEEKFPHFLCDECGSYTDAQIGEIMKVADFLIDFALTAAGVANDWTKLFEATKARMDAKK